ncbi:MAG: YebC/PmpR family DNA-binding transcriptional regulator [Myxococcota bacterium]
MSGHSKWSTIKRKKGVADAKRGKIFTKLIREISTAARMGGGEMDSNPRLRLVIEKAKAANMPKDNIERAVQKGIGTGEGDAYAEFVYEGYGPAGVAVLVEVLTDNKNRSVGEVRHLFSKFGGNLGANGCVSYLFEKKGLISFDRQGLEEDALLEAALDSGAIDVVEAEDSLDVIVAAGELERIKETLGRSFKVARAEISMEPTSTVKLAGSEAERMLRLADSLEDLDDVQSVHANFDISEEEMSSLV